MSVENKTDVKNAAGCEADFEAEEKSQSNM